MTDTNAPDNALREAIATAIFMSRKYDRWYPNGFTTAPADMREMCLRDADAAYDVIQKLGEIVN